MLKLSTKGRYATRIMVYLAMNNSGHPARKREISEAEGIPPDYVEQILMKLRTSGLVKSLRGAKGGFLLTELAEEITVADILEATEGPLALVFCLDENCERASECVTRPLWDEASRALYAIFTKTSVADLAEKATKIREARSLAFNI